jgi:hypothetical protein
VTPFWHFQKKAWECGFSGINAIGIDFATLILKASFTDQTESHHEIRNADAE